MQVFLWWGPQGVLKCLLNSAFYDLGVFSILILKFFALCLNISSVDKRYFSFFFCDAFPLPFLALVPLRIVDLNCPYYANTKSAYAFGSLESLVKYTHMYCGWLQLCVLDRDPIGNS